jgi:hypothetical protein
VSDLPLSSLSHRLASRSRLAENERPRRPSATRSRPSLNRAEPNPRAPTWQHGIVGRRFPEPGEPHRRRIPEPAEPHRRHHRTLAGLPAAAPRVVAARRLRVRRLLPGRRALCGEFDHCGGCRLRANSTTLDRLRSIERFFSSNRSYRSSDGVLNHVNALFSKALVKMEDEFQKQLSQRRFASQHHVGVLYKDHLTRSRC